jgi:hypothetical protein
MPADDFAFDIPELNRIGSLMRDLTGDAAAPAPRPRTRRAATGAATPRLAAATVGRFAETANWRNAEGVKSPFQATSAARPLGGLSVSAFAAGVNWTNSPDGSRLVAVAPGAAPGGPPETLESFMDNFAWD